jgi:hypothetical protein
MTGVITHAFFVRILCLRSNYKAYTVGNKKKTAKAEDRITDNALSDEG